MQGQPAGAKSSVRRAGRSLAARCRLGSDVPGGNVTLDVRTAGPRGDVAVVAVSGEIDLRTAEEVRSGLLTVVDAGFGRIIVDFDGVRFCDATGLGVLGAVRNRLEGPGPRVCLARVRPAQRRLFRITGLDRLFALHDSVEDAVRDGHAPSTAAQG